MVDKNDDINNMRLSYDIPGDGCSNEAYERLKEAARRNNDELKALAGIRDTLKERHFIRNSSGKRGRIGRTGRTIND